MSKALIVASDEARRLVAALFDNAPPVLVEVRFPHMSTSPDWYLLEEEEQLEPILERLAPGVELYVSSVWDLKNTKGEIHLKKSS
jgi:hypothetical protein